MYVYCTRTGSRCNHCAHGLATGLLKHNGGCVCACFNIKNSAFRLHSLVVCFEKNLPTNRDYFCEKELTGWSWQCRIVCGRHWVFSILFKLTSGSKTLKKLFKVISSWELRYSVLWRSEGQPLKMGQIGCPETSVRNYRNSLRSSPEQRSPHLLRGTSPKSRVISSCPVLIQNFLFV